MDVSTNLESLVFLKLPPKLLKQFRNQNDFMNQASLVQYRLLNPTISNDIELKLISSSTGLELPDVYPKKPNDGFEIQNARLPEHDGQIECVAETKDGTTDSVKYFLRFQGLSNFFLSKTLKLPFFSSLK